MPTEDANPEKVSFESLVNSAVTAGHGLTAVFSAPLPV